MRHALVALLALATPAAAALSPSQLQDVSATPPPGARLPAGLRFIDQYGRPFTLQAAPVPTILLFADYTCNHLCGPGITLTAGALHDAGLVTPRDYRFIVIGMDQDGPAKARKLIDDRLDGLDDVRRSIRLLTGTPATVAAAEKALGYHAVYDKAVDQFAHDAESYVFTPDGRLSRMLPETAVTPALLKGAIAAAAKGDVVPPKAPGNALSSFVAVCYGFAAAHGVHGRTIVILLQTLGVLTLAGIALMIWRLVRRARAQA